MSERTLLVSAVVTLAAAAAPLGAQAPLFLVDPETEVASVAFRFPDGQEIETGTLSRQIELQDPGLGYWIRSVVGVLPLVSSPTRERFSPPTLLRDQIRLERWYRDAGFRGAEVTYEVALDTAANSVDVHFVVREGRPVVLDSVQVRGPDDAPLTEGLPDELQEGWRDLEQDLAERRGARLSMALRVQLQDRIINWLRDRGYPWPTASADTLVAGAEGTHVRLRFQVDPGPRMRVGEMTVEGNRRLSDAVLRREVPLEQGDWFSRARLAEGQSELFGLDMIRLATLRSEDRPDDVAEGDRVDVRMRVTEGELRLISGRVGYGLTPGVSGDVSWSHRDFFGGARTFEASVLARTGILAPDATVARRYGLSLTLRQPWFFDHRVEGVLRPFVEYRDDLRDESVQFGSEASVLFQRGPRRSVALRYSLTSRRIIEAGPGAPLGQDTDLSGLLAGLDTLDLDRRTSSLSAVARWARAPSSDPGPQPDWSVFGNVEVAAPAGLSTVEYGKLVGEVAGSVPVGRSVTVRGRVGGGRVFPYGVSVPAPDGSDRLETYLQLRDAVLTAGGSQDVRGWGSELLGPKVPDLRGAELSEASSVRYVPLGGLARWTGSVQVGVPLPLVGSPHDLHVFLDAGRVWTPDGRFLPTDEPLVPDQLGDRVRFGTGIGVSIATPVGPVLLDIAYKLNPSVLDLRDPGEVGRALLEGRSVEDVPLSSIRRWHLHFGIGGVS